MRVGFCAEDRLRLVAFDRTQKLPGHMQGALLGFGFVLIKGVVFGVKRLFSE